MLKTGMDALAFLLSSQLGAKRVEVLRVIDSSGFQSSPFFVI